MIFKRNVADDLPVLLTDVSDLYTGLTGVAWGNVTVKYMKQGDTAWSTFTLDVNKWTEIGNGHYLISFSNTVLNTNGKFIYIATTAGAVDYPGSVEIRDNTNDTLATTLTAISAAIGNLNNFDPASDKVLLNDATQAEIDAIVGIVGNAGYGNEAIKDILEAIKGAGWSDETLVAIKTVIDLIVAKTTNLPANPTSEENATINKNSIISEVQKDKEVRITGKG